MTSSVRSLQLAGEHASQAAQSPWKKIKKSQTLVRNSYAKRLARALAGQCPLRLEIERASWQGWLWHAHALPCVRQPDSLRHGRKLGLVHVGRHDLVMATAEAVALAATRRQQGVRAPGPCEAGKVL